jgi:hypothetical protein
VLLKTQTLNLFFIPSPIAAVKKDSVNNKRIDVTKFFSEDVKSIGFPNLNVAVIKYQD